MKLVHETLVESIDNLGSLWTLHPNQGCPEVEVWLDHETDKLMIRQENIGSADVIELSNGQAYDMLYALGRALGSAGPLEVGR